MKIKGELTKEEVLHLIRNAVAKELGERPTLIKIEDAIAEDNIENTHTSNFTIKFTVKKIRS